MCIDLIDKDHARAKVVLCMFMKPQKSYSSHYDNSFEIGVKAARLWNLLPKHENQQSTLGGFKKALGKFLDQF